MKLVLIATFSLILLVNCEPQRGYPNDEQLTINSNSNRNENRYRNDRRKEGNPRNQERDNEERDQREYRNQGRERSRGNQAPDNVDGRVPERHGAYGGNYGYPLHEGLDYANVAEHFSGRDNYRELKKDDRRIKEYKNREYDPYYPKYFSPEKNYSNYDFYEMFPYPGFAGRRGLGFQRRTYLVNGYTSPLTKELLEIVGKRRDFEYDKNYHRVSDYYDLYEPKHEPRYDDRELYYGKKEYKYERQDLYKTPYPEARPLEYQKGLVNNPIGRELLETVGKNYNYNSAYYPNLY
ncbi:uncharacterized protein LOC110997041 [Pieris rapae]|uniref:uncharacterized protein LOC110997041 n=1 Tax=Pieris rapae TaxID=64459 RepID=UPI000B92AD47|nr:uncharacterized protein LOC110997041 [Pieris rapae]